VLAAATDRDGRAVVIRLVAMSEDGQSELRALRRLAKSPVGLLPSNHVLPYQAELIKDGMTFMVFPLVGQTGFADPWFYSFSEVIDAMTQVLEVRSLSDWALCQAQTS
jgi:hypothetical protein